MSIPGKDLASFFYFCCLESLDDKYDGVCFMPGDTETDIVLA